MIARVLQYFAGVINYIVEVGKGGNELTHLRALQTMHSSVPVLVFEIFWMK